MSTRRTLLFGFSCAALALPLAVPAQPGATPEEQELREVLRDYEHTWNLHDAAAWSSFLADDIWFTQGWDFYGRQKGRDNAVNLFKSNYLDSDLTLHVLRLRMMPDGTATVAMRVVVSYLPKTDGKYRVAFENDPAIGRWRKEGEKWKLFFFTSDKGWALDQLKKDGVE